MALDALLLEHSGPDSFLRWWKLDEPVYTFGRGQKIEEVKKKLPVHQAHTGLLAPHAPPLQRRLTGGGLLPHARTWTWSCVLPKHHGKAPHSAQGLYEFLHQALKEALSKQGVEGCVYQGAYLGKNPAPASCFEELSHGDLIDPYGRKVGGAAQARKKHAVLTQGIIRQSLLGELDELKLYQAFKTSLANKLRLRIKTSPLPKLVKENFAEKLDWMRSEKWQSRH